MKGIVILGVDANGGIDHDLGCFGVQWHFVLVAELCKSHSFKMLGIGWTLS